ncbi:MAG TPA: hemerythrin domain-containing protein [Acidimicrobiales bacterium]|nr:hemerythrin domain-containing protein [Acidimicrobiales bacterium]
MPDICDLILDQHDTQRRRFAELDELRSAGPDALAQAWAPLATFLELHAAAEEQVFYPKLLDAGRHATDETDDAISDHNKIRDAVRASRDREVDTDEWWEAVDEARAQNGDHMAEEERGALADYRSNTSAETRTALGAEFEAFCREHADGRGLRPHDKDPERYIEEHSPGR